MSLPGYVEIGHDLLTTLPDHLESRGLGGNAFIIADRNVGAIYGARTHELLESTGCRVAYKEIPPGETAKALSKSSELYDWLLDSRAERGDLIIALGGGVIGDLVGFVAATYMRGLRWAQIATTLLAQVDSSIGGKVGVDLPGGKNLVGAFHPPSLSLLDIDVLSTLPHRQLAAGWAEVIKHSAILDAEFFQLLEDRLRDSTDLADPSLLLLAVRRCVEIKAGVVQQDPFDRGLRAILNYGHTIAHAIEASTGYQGYLHGEAVAIGMAGAAAIGRQLGLIDAGVEQRQNDLLARAGLPLQYDGATPDSLLDAITRDKKVVGGRPRWVLLEELGRATPDHEVSLDLARTTVVNLHS